MIELYQNQQITFTNNDLGIHFKWCRPRNTFQDSDILSGQIEVFFQIDVDEERCLVRVDEISVLGIESFIADRWYSKQEFLEYTGIHDGICSLPFHEDEVINEEYRKFCDKYNIHLNSQQERAVQAIEGANLILAVPGSGKTTVLVARLGYMILCRGINPENILSITYTTAAAKDMSSRFAKIFGVELAKRLQFQTINSLCYDIIGYYAFKKETTAYKIDSVKRTDILKQLLIESLKSFPVESDYVEAKTAITIIKNNMLSAEEIKALDTNIPDFLSFYKKYLSKMIESKIMDFDDQMDYSLRILKKYPDILGYYQEKYQYICVDEAQDTSKLQHKLIRLLSDKYNNIFMVGDEDQSIYRFRGAYPQALMNFRNDYVNPFILYMERNYRSTQEIVDTAHKFIEKNIKRHPKHMVADRGHGEKIVHIPVKNRIDQYEFLLKELQQKHEHTAILYRDNECAIPLIDLLLRNNIMYYVSANQMLFFNSRPVTDMISFLRLITNPLDTDAFMQIYYKCGMRFSKETAMNTCDLSRDKRIPVTNALIESLSQQDELRVKAEKFSRILYKASRKNTVNAMDYIYNSMYKQYTKDNKLTVDKLEIMRILASSEPCIDSFLKRFDCLPELIEKNSKKTEDAVILSTMHSSKGQEYDTVYIIDFYDGYIPKNSSHDSDEKKIDSYQEERRLFYVAMTRAKNKLCIFGIDSMSSEFAYEIFPEQYKTNKVIAGDVVVEEMPQVSVIPDFLRRIMSPMLNISNLFGGSESNAHTINETNSHYFAKSRQIEERHSQYEIGYNEVKDQFTQQTSIIRDHYKYRWAKCEMCNAIKREDEFATYGGEQRVNIGICKVCQKIKRES